MMMLAAGRRTSAQAATRLGVLLALLSRYYSVLALVKAWEHGFYRKSCQKCETIKVCEVNMENAASLHFDTTSPCRQTIPVC